MEIKYYKLSYTGLILIVLATIIPVVAPELFIPYIILLPLINAFFGGTDALYKQFDLEQYKHKPWIQKLFIPAGRLKRLPYFLSLCSISIIVSILNVLSKELTNTIAGLFFAIVSTIVIPLYITTMIKRGHDFGWSAWKTFWYSTTTLLLGSCCFILFQFLGIHDSVQFIAVGLIIFSPGLILLFQRSEASNNLYGPYIAKKHPITPGEASNNLYKKHPITLGNAGIRRLCFFAGLLLCTIISSIDWCDYGTCYLLTDFEPLKSFLYLTIAFSTPFILAKIIEYIVDGFKQGQ